MPKIKTSRGAAKRLKRTGTGRLKRRRAFRNHILTKKTTKSKRQKRTLEGVGATDIKSARRLLALQ